MSLPLPFGARRPTPGTELPYTNTGQYYDGCYARGTFYQSFQLSTVCWLIPSSKIAVLNVNYNSNKLALSTKSPTLYILLYENPFMSSITAVSTCFN